VPAALNRVIPLVLVLHRRACHGRSGHPPRCWIAGGCGGQAAGHGLGADAYPDLHAKAAALVHSLARNHALADGNKRLALGALVAFYGINGRRLTLTNDAAYELIMQVAAGELDSVDEIAAILEKSTGPRP
jgi:hypothetical protein